MREAQIEAAIIQQVNWIFEAVNLQHDAYLHSVMDVDLWVPIAALLEFPRFKAMRVTNTPYVKSVLRHHCTNVVVHSLFALVRPAWARPPMYSNLFKYMFNPRSMLMEPWLYPLDYAFEPVYKHGRNWRNWSFQPGG